MLGMWQLTFTIYNTIPSSQRNVALAILNHCRSAIRIAVLNLF